MLLKDAVPALAALALHTQWPAAALYALCAWLLLRMLVLDARRTPT